MEKNIKNNVYICVYITESLFYTAEINTTLWTNYTSIKKKKTSDMQIPSKPWPGHLLLEERY